MGSRSKRLTKSGGTLSSVRARFGRDRRVRKSAEFGTILKKGCHGASAALGVVAVEAAGRGRLGISAPVKIGKAVVRNRARRLVREAYRQMYKGNSPYDIVVSLKPQPSAAALGEMKRALDEAISAAVARGKNSRWRHRSGN